MPTFGELAIGTRFDLNIDADGNEPYFYKVSDAEGYIEHGQNAGMREKIASDTKVWERDVPVTLHDHPTDVERVALTLLAGPSSPQPSHPGLAHYVLALGGDPDELRDLDEYIVEATVPTAWTTDEAGYRIPTEQRPLRDICDEQGYIYYRRDFDFEHSAMAAILSHRPKDERLTNKVDRRLAMIDDILCRLARAVHDYRVAGRLEGEQSFNLQGLGGSLGTVITSLAAAVVEFHYQMMNLVASRE